MEENENQELDDKDVEMESSEETKTDNSSESKKPMFIAIAVLALLALGAFFVFGAPNPMEDNEELESVESQNSVDQQSDIDEDATYEDEYVLDEESEDVSETDLTGDAKVIEIEGGSYYYNPDVIEVKKGDTVRIVLTSVDMMHDFVIDELNVQTEILKSGETGEVEFTVDEVGEYEYYCSVGNHRAQGMVGTLVVTE